MLTEIDDATEQITPPVVPAETPNDKVTLTRAEVDGLRRDRDEARESEKYWAGVARNGRAAEPATEPEEDDASQFIDEDAPDGIEGDTPEKLVDEFAAQGTKALDKRGYVKAADVKKMAAEIAIKVARQMIGQQVVRSTTDAQIMTAYPELKDPNSELFKATAKIYQEAVAMDPSAQKTPAALFLAAKAAKASLKPPPKAREDEDDYEPEVESDRRRRADSQDSRPRGRGQVEDHDDMMGPEARQICKDMGITEAEFKESMKATSRPRGRR
jgi:hypothetical protein